MTVATDVAQIINPACVYTPAELALRIGGKKSTVITWIKRKEDPLPCGGEVGSTIKLIKGEEFVGWYFRNFGKAVGERPAPHPNNGCRSPTLDTPRTTPSATLAMSAVPGSSDY